MKDLRNPYFSEAQPEEIVPEGTLMGAAFRSQTTVGALAQTAKHGPSYRFEDLGAESVLEGYNALEDLDLKYRPYADRFAGVADSESAERLKSKIDDELRDRAIFDRNTGLAGFAATAAVQFADPINYIGGASIRGATLGQKAFSGAKAGGISAAAQEGVLYSQQETRTVGESAVGVGASVVFGGILGAGAHLLGPKALAEIEESYTAPQVGEREQIGQSVGAAAVNPVTGEDLTVNAAQQAVLNATPNFLFPLAEVSKAQSVTAKQTGLNLMENFLSVEGVETGAVTQAVETSIRSSAGSYDANAELVFRSAYKDYMEEAGVSSVDVLARRRANQEFRNRVGVALRNGDVDPNSVAVTKAAKGLREKVYEPILKQAQREGLLPEGITTKTALSYFRRSYNQNTLSARQAEFESILKNHFIQGMRQGAFGKLDELRRQLSASQNELFNATSDQGGEFVSQVELDQLEADLRQMDKDLKGVRKFPVIEALKSRGGVDPDSVIGQEFLTLGITPRSHPAFFRKGGLSDVDNIDSLGPDIDDLIKRDGYYFDRSDLIDTVAEEVSGTPRRSQEVANKIDSAETLREFLEETVGQGVTLKQYQALLKDLGDATAKVKDAEAKIDNSTFDQDLDFMAEEAARGVWNTLTGNDGGFESPIVAVVQGPLKGRTLNIPDNLIADFLVDDAMEVTTNYIRTMVAEIELKSAFGRPDMRDQLAKIQEEYSELKKGKSEKEAVALDRERASITEMIEANRDRLRGTYLAKENGTTIAKAVRAAKDFNFVRMLGETVLSAAPDPFRIAQVHGFTNLLGPSGMKIMKESLKAIRADRNLSNFMRDEPEVAGIAEVLLNSRAQSIADVDDPFPRQGAVESTMRELSNIGAVFSGMNHWNQFWKQVAYQHGVERMKRIAAVGFDNARPKDKKWLKTLKVSRSDFNRVADQLEKNSIAAGNLTDANSGAWNDAFAQRVFRNALSADTNSVIVTPGVGDKPLFADHPIGSMAFQFKSFFLATHSRALVRGLGEDQTDFLSGAAMMVAAGMAVYYMKSYTSNFETSDNVGVWIAEGLDRSGVLSVPMEINNMLEPSLNRMGAGGVYTGLGAAFGDSDALSSRYRFRSDPFAAMFGPSASILRDGGGLLFDAGKEILTGEGIDEGTVGAAGRLMPFANHPGIKQMMRYFIIPELKEIAG